MEKAEVLEGLGEVRGGTDQALVLRFCGGPLQPCAQSHKSGDPAGGRDPRAQTSGPYLRHRNPPKPSRSPRLHPEEEEEEEDQRLMGDGFLHPRLICGEDDT